MPLCFFFFFWIDPMGEDPSPGKTQRFDVFQPGIASARSFRPVSNRGRAGAALDWDTATSNNSNCKFVSSRGRRITVTVTVRRIL
jgi:hypothetical protein